MDHVEPVTVSTELLLDAQLKWNVYVVGGRFR
jgi:hypothetical protein